MIFIVTVAWMFSTGCSIYRIVDSYAGVEVRVGTEYKQDDALATLRIEENVVFESIGPLCLPIIPLVNSNKITVISFLLLRNEHPFSINAKPCIVTDASKKICANMLTASAKATFPHDYIKSHEEPKDRLYGVIGAILSREAKKYGAFEREDELLVDPSEDNSVSRIGTEELYKHYNYGGDPRWEDLQITFTYTFTCAGSCPNKFTLDAKDFLTIGNEMFLDAEYDYVKKERQKRFYFMF